MTLQIWQIWTIGGLVLLVVIVAIIAVFTRVGSDGSFISGFRWLSDKKTYIVGGCILAVDQLYDLGVVPADTAWKIQKTLFAIGTFTIAAAQARLLQMQQTAVVTSKIAAVNSQQTARTLENVLAEETTPLPSKPVIQVPKKIEAELTDSPFRQ